MDAEVSDLKHTPDEDERMVTIAGYRSIHPEYRRLRGRIVGEHRGWQIVLLETGEKIGFRWWELL